MKSESIRPTIVIFVVVTLFFAFFIPAGQPRFRLKERIQAIEAYTMSPSKYTKAAVDDEFARLHHHEAGNGIIFILAPVLLLDAAVIYFFWNYGKRGRTTRAS